MLSNLLSTTATRDLVAIPPELLIRILRNLDAVSLARCAMTCVCLNNIVKNASQLMYIIHLHLDGLKDCGTSLPKADSVALLLQRRHAWLSLEWMERVTSEIPNDFRAADAWDLAGGALAYTDEEILEIITLPTLTDVKGYTVRRAWDSTQSAHVPCFAMDPTQDLIVFLENTPSQSSTAAVDRIHVRTMSGGVPHPLAFQSALELTGESLYGYPIDDSMDPVLQITHNLLALSFEVQETRFLIWDWTTSELLLDSAISFDRSLKFLSYMGGCAINLLDSIHFLFACSNDSGSLRLYKLNRSVSVDNVPAIHLATLHLPPLDPTSDIGEISILTGPLQANSLPHSPFMENDEDRLHVLRIKYHYEGDQMDDGQIGLLFTHQRVLTKYIAEHDRLGGPALDIPWAEWGPHNTRLICPVEGLDGDGLDVQSRYVHGQRAAFPGRGSSSTDIEVFDFSLAAVLSAKGCIPAPSASSWELSSSTRVGPSYDCPFFADNFSTYLPYVRITRDVKLQYSDVLIYADGIVCMKNRLTDISRDNLAHVYAI
ncbi:hypothetical protein BJ912DRAFT_686105 [Pholiota molesta]|nr:hypothetical protein BJ912DRAFT_686105 [Pholiota molesta]